jgi:PiT family inorganic phosphate transporter
MGLGTLTGGWRVIETMGTRITKLSQHQGFSASAGASIMLFAASWLGIPVSTTHTVTGCVIGAGAARRASAVRWGIAGDVAIAWVITIPASAIVAAIFYWLVSAEFVRAAIVIAVIVVLGWLSTRLTRRHLPQGEIA